MDLYEEIKFNENLWRNAIAILCTIRHNPERTPPEIFVPSNYPLWQQTFVKRCILLFREVANDKQMTKKLSEVIHYQLQQR